MGLRGLKARPRRGRLLGVPGKNVFLSSQRPEAPASLGAWPHLSHFCSCHRLSLPALPLPLLPSFKDP